MIPQEVIDQIKERADIIDVARSFMELKKRGNDYWGCCPFHKEKTPSFKLNQERNGYYCFGCKEHGNVIDFVKAMTNTDFVGALHWLAERYGITIPENSNANPEEARRVKSIHDRRLALLSEVSKWYQTLLRQPAAENARNYLQSRGIDEWTISHFALGYSPDSWDGVIKWAEKLGYTMEDLIATGLVGHKEDNNRYYDFFRNRLMFPIHNELGKVVGFSARTLEADAKMMKYINTTETEFFQKGQLLYALHFARTSFKDFGYAMICEGQLDVISCHRAGLTNAVAAQGTAFTEMHARILAKSVNRIVLCFDADSAGYKASERTITILHGAGMTVSVITLPSGEDPDSVFRKGGADALKSMLLPEAAEDAIPYLFRVACLDADISRPDGKSVIVNRVLKAVQPIKDEIVRVGHCQWLAKQMDLPENIVINTLNKLPDPNARPHHFVQRPAMPVHTPPAFRMQQPVDQNWSMLLDIILHIEEYARELTYTTDVLNMVPNTPVGMAINQIVVMCGQDEWANAIEALSSSELFRDETVGKCIMASQTGDVIAKVPNDANHKAFTDCLNRIRLNEASRQILQKQAELATISDSAEKNKLMAEISKLVHEKSELKNAMI